MKRNNQFWFLRFDDDYDKTKETFREYRNNRELYYDHNKKMWVHRAEYTNNWYPADFPCHSYKAALRHLRKHDEIPKGTRFLLVSKFVGCDRVLIKR